MALRRHKLLATLGENVTEHVTQIISEDTVFHLRDPINLSVHRDHGHWLVGYEPLGLEGYGDTEEEALESFADQFRSTWMDIACEENQRLTRDAQQLKRKMLKLVESVGQ